MTSNAKAEGRFDKSDLMSKRDAAFRLQPARSCAPGTPAFGLLVAPIKARPADFAPLDHPC